MIHLRARGLLSALPDGGLAPELEARVRAHAAGCVRCQRILAEYTAVERLLRSFPAEILPPEPSAEADRALGLVDRWLGPERPAWFERLPIHPIGALITAALLLVGVFVLTPPFEVESAEPFNVVVVHPTRVARVERPRRVAATSQPLFREHSESYLLPVAVR